MDNVFHPIATGMLTSAPSLMLVAATEFIGWKIFKLQTLLSLFFDGSIHLAVGYLLQLTLLWTLGVTLQPTYIQRK